MKVLTAIPTDFDLLEQGDLFKIMSEQYERITTQYLMVDERIRLGQTTFYVCWTLSVSEYGTVTFRREPIPLTTIEEQFVPVSLGELLHVFQRARHITNQKVMQASLEVANARHEQAQLDTLADEVWGVL